MPWRKQVVSYLAAFYGSLHICKTSQLASTPHLLLTYKPPLTTVCAGKYLAGEPVSYRMCSTNVTFPAAWSGHVLPVDGLRCSQVVFGFFNGTPSPWNICVLLHLTNMMFSNLNKWHSQILGSFELSLLSGLNRPYVVHFWLKNNFSDLHRYIECKFKQNWNT